MMIYTDWKQVALDGKVRFRLDRITELKSKELMLLLQQRRLYVENVSYVHLREHNLVRVAPLDRDNPHHVALATVYLLWAWELYRMFEASIRSSITSTAGGMEIRADLAFTHSGERKKEEGMRLYELMFGTVLPRSSVRMIRALMYHTDALGFAGGSGSLGGVKISVYRFNLQLGFTLLIDPIAFLKKVGQLRHPLVRVSGNL